MLWSHPHFFQKTICKRLYLNFKRIFKCFARILISFLKNQTAQCLHLMIKWRSIECFGRILISSLKKLTANDYILFSNELSSALLESSFLSLKTKSKCLHLKNIWRSIECFGRISFLPKKQTANAYILFSKESLSALLASSFLS